MCIDQSGEKSSSDDENSERSRDVMKPKNSLPVNTLFSWTVNFQLFFLFFFVVVIACVKLVLTTNMQTLVPFYYLFSVVKVFFVLCASCIKRSWVLK